MSQISTGYHLYYKQYWIWTVFSTCRVPGFVLDPVLGRVYPKQVTSHWEVCELSTLAEGPTDLTLFPTRLQTHMTHWPSSLWGYESATQLLAGPSVRQRLPFETLAASPNEVKLHRFPSTVWLLPQPHPWDPSRDGGRGMGQKWLLPLHPCTPHSRCRLGLHRMTYPLLIRGLD